MLTRYTQRRGLRDMQYADKIWDMQYADKTQYANQALIS